MSDDWTEARVDGFGVFVALAGTSTTGKSMSALELGTGIARARGGDLGVLDTEAGRIKHYADKYKFRRRELQAPFHPDRFGEAAQAAEHQGFGALIIDNFSLEWSGMGGVLDLQEQDLEARVARDKRDMPDEKKRFKHLRASWIEPKRPHKRMLQTFLQLRIPIIFCIRANLVVETDDDGVKKPERWKPDQDKRFIYEWTVSFTLHPDTPGKPRYDMPHKCEEQHRHLFPAGQFITREAGAGLWKWANSGASIPSEPATPKATAPVPGPPPAAVAPKGAAPSDSAAPADIFPGDLPNKSEQTQGDQLRDMARDKALDFVAELVGEIRKRRKPEDVRSLMAHKPVRTRMDLLLQSFPDLHQQIMDIVAEHGRGQAA
jgi:hypothetical protein